MEKTFYLTIISLLIFASVACERTQPSNTETKAQTKTSEKTEPQAQNKTEEAKIDAEETKSVYPSLKEQAEAMGAAFTAHDFDKFADFMYPKLVEAAGGRDKFMATLNDTMRQMKSAGGDLVGYEIGEPDAPIEIDNQLFSVVPTEKTTKLREKTVSDKGSILAVSEDKGNNWKFVRVKSKESVRPLFPKAVDKLTFPERIVK